MTNASGASNKLIGLTGGIASGKSTIARMLRERGVMVIDADVVAREVVEPGQPALEEIRAGFGDGVFYASGELDRAKLGAAVFANDAARRALNAITHPRVAERAMEQLAAAHAAGHRIVVYEVPLLFENNLDAMMDATILVAVAPDVQLQRLMARDKLSAVDAQARVDAQMPLAEKRARATYVIDNGSNVDDSARQLDAVWTKVTNL